MSAVCMPSPPWPFLPLPARSQCIVRESELRALLPPVFQCRSPTPRNERPLGSAFAVRAPFFQLALDFFAAMASTRTTSDSDPPYFSPPDSGTSLVSSSSGSADYGSTVNRRDTGKRRDEEHVGALSIHATTDPYMLRAAWKSEEELDGLRRRKAGKRLVKYHVKQNALISSLLKSIEEHTEEAKAEEAESRLPIQIAIYTSLIGNFLLCVLQIYAAVTSASLSLLATSVDATFDFGSNVVLYWLHRKALSLDTGEWPVGGARLETIGNIVYGTSSRMKGRSLMSLSLGRMSSVNLVVLVESVQELAMHLKKDDEGFHIPSLIAVGVALGAKILLFLYCSSFRAQSSQVRVLWEDHRNDIFINAFGLVMSAGGSKWVWWLDPLGGIILAVGVIVLWGATIYEQFGLLAGRSAPHDFLQLVIYKAMTFSDEIEKIDTVRAYHSGPEYFVEVDVVMAAHTPLWRAHDISQQLQDKLESLPHVERAFVHVDHETTHAPEHRKSI
ncbi:hypothetical protein FOMPIDRAFT_1046948 [Fomitopsis schrenkii]|uniref:Uncharacterized protein n=1 Tax=Fomitopsis schrenkii TaxID=2126942 RepID=S8EJB3_FOMSC|nr:hypothetical protein FOMPIDRAFT_1046948 [Fomitopsis schrenkii]